MNSAGIPIRPSLHFPQARPAFFSRWVPGIPVLQSKRPAASRKLILIQSVTFLMGRNPEEIERPCGTAVNKQKHTNEFSFRNILDDVSRPCRSRRWPIEAEWEYTSRHALPAWSDSSPGFRIIQILDTRPAAARVVAVICPPGGTLLWLCGKLAEHGRFRDTCATASANTFRRAVVNRLQRTALTDHQPPVFRARSSGRESARGIAALRKSGGVADAV